MTTPLTPGAWSPTGWGRQHRVRAADHTVGLVWWVCGAGPDTRKSASPIHRVRTTTAGEPRCTTCERIPDLGPLPVPVPGQARRDPTTGTIVIAGLTCDGRRPTSPVDTAWRIVPGTDGHLPRPHPDRLSTYEVANWQPCPPPSVPDLAAAHGHHLWALPGGSLDDTSVEWQCDREGCTAYAVMYYDDGVPEGDALTDQCTGAPTGEVAS